jgi:predicted glycosyltransferase
VLFHRRRRKSCLFRNLRAHRLNRYQVIAVIPRPPVTQTRAAPRPTVDESPRAFIRRVAEPRPSAWPKILLYSHDTFGLGNIRRTLLLAQALTDEYPRAAILIVTGSPMIHAFRIPDGVDYIKLPCLDRVEADRYQPLYLSECSREVKRTRREILKNAVLGFAPDLMVVDKRPTGIDGELHTALQVLRERHRGTKVVLGLRDILDERERVIPSLKRSKFFEAIDRFYDEVWVYGVETLFDAVTEYGFPPSVANKTVFCGYLQRPVAEVPAGNGAVRVLVTTGGGGDGAELIRCYLEGLVGLPRRLAIHTTVVFGPQMSTTCRAALREGYEYLRDVTFVDFEPDLTRRYAEADVVVSMAGYNTVCELLSMRRRAVLVPRAEPVREQLIRARLFAGLGYFEVVEPQDLNAQTLIAKVLDVSARPPLTEAPVDMDGLPRIRERVRSLLEGEP